jgi:hypothetical protein
MAGKFPALPYFPLSFGLLAMTQQQTAKHSKQCLMAGDFEECTYTVLLRPVRVILRY